jgi:hypothetical protein
MTSFTETDADSISGPATTPSADSTGPTPSSSAGTTDSTSDAGTDTGDPPPPRSTSRVLFFYTPHGYFADQAWTGSGEAFELGSMLAPLEPWRDDLLIVDGISNHSEDPKGMPVIDEHSTSVAGLLTGGLLGSGSGGDENFDPHYAGGPSLDVRLGQLLPPRPNTSVHLAVRTSSSTLPLGVSYLAANQENIPWTNPQDGFQALFSRSPADPILDALQAQIDSSLTLVEHVDAQLAVAHAALALDVTNSALVSVDLGIPQIVWSELGVDIDFHTATVDQAFDTAPVYAAWGQSLATFVADLAATPDPEGGTLLDSTLVVWVSDFGPNPLAHSRNAILCVIIDASGALATGQVAQVDADQADLAATIATALDVELGAFGDPALGATPIASLLAP